MDVNIDGSIIDFSIDDSGKYIAGIFTIDPQQNCSVFVQRLILKEHKKLNAKEQAALREKLELETERQEDSKRTIEKHKPKSLQQRLQQN
jgi:hypothetical protein